jgi:hypothetical protein
MLTPQHIYQYCIANNRRWIQKECIVAQSTEYSYLYAINVIRGRFFLAEPTIKKGTVQDHVYIAQVVDGVVQIVKDKKRPIIDMKFKTQYEKEFNCTL